MKIAKFGDTHGEMEMGKMAHHNFKEGTSFTKDDMAVVLGDFGLFWSGSDTEKYWLKWLQEKKYNIVVVPGNHENYEMIFSLPVVPFMGGEAYQGGKNIFVLKRGGVFNFGGKIYFAMGGALSVDRGSRRNRISWWEEETPSKAEWDYAFENLEKVGWKVDYVISHDIHEAGRRVLYGEDSFKKCPVSFGLEAIREKLDYKTWYCGHHHVDRYLVETRTQILYNTYKVLEF